MDVNISVCAVVITYNRKELLAETLEAIHRQTRQPDHVLILDNCSTDDTFEFVKREYPSFEVVRLEENTGCAGGAHHGLKAAFAQGFDWCWLMDDDCEPKNDALEKLIDGLILTKKLETQPMLMLSRDVWRDMKLHPYNVPWIDIRRPRHVWDALQYGLLPIRWSVYASMLIRREAIEQFGLPIPEYFLWNDDVEWTGAILRKNYGYWVLGSIAIHKTSSPNPPALNKPERFYLEVRNRLWMLRTTSWGFGGKIAWSWHLFVEMIHFLLIHRKKGWEIIQQGWRDGSGPLPNKTRTKSSQP